MNRATHGAVVFGGLLLGIATISLLQKEKPNTQLEVSNTALALDGDTFISQGERFRIAGIDAPELPGHCRGYRLMHNTCAPGDPWASRRELQAELLRGIICRRQGLDYYGRTLASCTISTGADLGQLMVTEGYAIPYQFKENSHAQ